MIRKKLFPAALVALNVAAAATLVATGGSTTMAATEPPKPSSACVAPGTVLTVEEQRTTLSLPGRTTPAARDFIEAAGFEGIVDDFAAKLCDYTSVGQAGTAIKAAGAALWKTAVDRAQGRLTSGTIDRYDDRPLYWARTSMSRAVREWQAPFPLTSLQRQAILRQFNYASRGIDQVAFPKNSTKLLVSGFDTYSLDASLRNSNPSGASALQLDGRTVKTKHGTVTIQAVVFPVNWTDFDQGIVEDAFGPWLVNRKDPRYQGAIDALMTISQTGRGQMNIEKWAGGFRGGSPDNNRSINWGPISAAALWPQPQPSPQFIHTTLPYQAMIDAGTGPWPVKLNPGITEWPAGTFPDPTALRTAPDPSPGSRAASAPGGNYLSNESMYRTNRLRLGTGHPTLPGGHLHISALEYPTDASALTSPAFEADRKAVVDQTVALVEAAGKAVRR
ncbi:hypothetical protein ACQPXM_38265 [Kribbella sp. CA-253562]|uniref:hypothetical protein n=1 Tax=Kribbella sp. CA-253562 TaxID=3239942 RepID=UPI003D8C35B2